MYNYFLVGCLRLYSHLCDMYSYHYDHRCQERVSIDITMTMTMIMPIVKAVTVAFTVAYMCSLAATHYSSDTCRCTCIHFKAV